MMLILIIFQPFAEFDAPPELVALIYGVSFILVIAFGYQALQQAWEGNIRLKVVTSFTMMAVVSVGVVGLVAYLSFRNQVREDIRQRLVN